MINRKFIYSLLLLAFALTVGARPPQKKLRFAFMTDIHLSKDGRKSCFEGLQAALKKVKESKVDFILLGGDQTDISAMGNDMSKRQADSLYTAFKEIVAKENITLYPAIGNHDRYFDQANGYTEGDELFKEHFKESYYTFEAKGIRFFVLNSVQLVNDKDYSIGEKQMNWLKEELAKVPPSTPIIVSTHVPVYSIYYPVVAGKYVFYDVITNYQELLKAFKGHNLKLVLQGHQHLYEEIFSQNVQYITGGAVSAHWWEGPSHETEEGFLIIDADDTGQFDWKYTEYGWEAEKHQ